MSIINCVMAFSLCRECFVVLWRSLLCCALLGHRTLPPKKVKMVVDEEIAPLLCKALWVSRKALYKCNKLLLLKQNVGVYLKGIAHPKIKNAAIIYSSSSFYIPLWVSFAYWRQKKIFFEECLLSMIPNDFLYGELQQFG